MNVSMQDIYNLKWKLCFVFRELVHFFFFSIYSIERRIVAQELIFFDHRFSRLFSGRLARSDTDEIDIFVEEFKVEFEKSLLFIADLFVNYVFSFFIVKLIKINSDETFQNDLIKNIKLNMRFFSVQVFNQVDVRFWQFFRFFRSDDRWRIILFVDNIAFISQFDRIQNFCIILFARGNFLSKYIFSSQEINSLIEILTIHSSSRQQINLLDLSNLLHSFDKEIDWAYEKIFVNDWNYQQEHEKTYEKWNVVVDKECVIALRSDMYVDFVDDTENVRKLKKYFFEMLLANKHWKLIIIWIMSQLYLMIMHDCLTKTNVVVRRQKILIWIWIF